MAHFVIHEADVCFDLLGMGEHSGMNLRLQAVEGGPGVLCGTGGTLAGRGALARGLLAREGNGPNTGGRRLCRCVVTVSRAGFPE